MLFLFIKMRRCVKKTHFLCLFTDAPTHLNNRKSTLLLGQLTFLITHFQVLDHIAIYHDVPWTIVFHFQSFLYHSATSREEWLEIAHRKKKNIDIFFSLS